ncbi:MAG TPA: helix-turn-helix transcriptional regulator [Ktedonobacteraceae bacterium]
MEKVPLYPNSLRMLIETAGYSFKEIAREANISERTLYYWAAGNRVIPHRDRITLAHVLGCTPEDLTPCRNTNGVVQLPQDYSQPWDQGEMNKKRRELLQLLSIAASIMLLPEIDWERIDRVVSAPSLLDKAGLSNLEAINHHYWRVYGISSAKITILDGVLGQLKTLIGLLRASYSAPLQRGLNILACDLAQLAGEIFFDSNDYDTAQSCYTFAAAAAKEVTHYDLWACALVRNAFLPIYDRQYRDALPLLHQAERIAARGDPSLVTRYWVAAVTAEAYAGAGDLALCQKGLDMAEGVRGIQNGENGGWLRFGGSRLPEQRGTCFVRLQEPNLAMPALDEALAQHPTPTRRRGMVLNDLAQAALQEQHVEQACTYAHEVIEIALQGSSGMLKKGLYALREQLEPFAQTGAVRQLDQHLRVLA